MDSVSFCSTLKYLSTIFLILFFIFLWIFYLFFSRKYRPFLYSILKHNVCFSVTLIVRGLASTFLSLLIWETAHVCFDVYATQVGLFYIMYLRTLGLILFLLTYLLTAYESISIRIKSKPMSSLRTPFYRSLFPSKFYLFFLLRLLSY